MLEKLVILRYLKARQQLSGGGVGWFSLAWTLSLLFHPLFIPTISALVLFRFAPELLPVTEDGKRGILGFLFISTFLLPAGAIALFWASGLIRNLSMDERKDRHLPHLAAFLSYLGVAYLLDSFLPMLRLPFCLMLGSAISVGFTGIITLFWKISSHMVGMGGLLGFQIFIARQAVPASFFFPVLISILLCGAVASARYFLKAHDGLQLLAGFFLGMVISSATIAFFA
jgi:hypothetical protein